MPCQLQSVVSELGLIMSLFSNLSDIKESICTLSKQLVTKTSDSHMTWAQGHVSMDYSGPQIVGY